MKYNYTKYLVESILGEEYAPTEVPSQEVEPTDEMGHYTDLMSYMSSNGLNIEPFPQVTFVDDDQDNAESLFGKTAYYNPADKSIVLYTYGRHPKDILRSFAHELVHLHQDNEGRIGNIQTTNTNEDDDLVELEREAYEKGNMMFRQWTDSLSEDKKEYGINAYAAELARLRESKLPKITEIYCDINKTLTDVDTDMTDWTTEGLKLWEYIKKYSPTLLSNTSNEERKTEFIRENFGENQQFIFKEKEKKQEYSKPGSVLIDNSKKIIELWEKAGGIGIRFKNADQAIGELKQIGL